MVKALFLLLWIPFTGEFPVNLRKSLDVVKHLPLFMRVFSEFFRWFPHVSSHFLRLQVLSGRVVIPRIRYEVTAGAAADSSVDWFTGKP
jgi:hypothetical protein